MSKSAKTPATISMAELAGIAEKASRLAGAEARAAGIKVSGIDVSEPGAAKKHAGAKKPVKQRI